MLDEPAEIGDEQGKRRFENGTAADAVRSRSSGSDAAKAGKSSVRDPAGNLDRGDDRQMVW